MLFDSIGWLQRPQWVRIWHSNILFDRDIQGIQLIPKYRTISPWISVQTVLRSMKGYKKKLLQKWETLQIPKKLMKKWNSIVKTGRVLIRIKRNFYHACSGLMPVIWFVYKSETLVHIGKWTGTETISLTLNNN